MSKHPEARISIFLPTLKNLKSKSVYDMQKEYGQLYQYEIPFYDTNEKAFVITDRLMSQELAEAYYEQVMNYHQGISENLLQEEEEIRDKEVREKWLNGNFNYWLFEEEKEVE
jgi:curved DNA-binding protein CbpA